MGGIDSIVCAWGVVACGDVMQWSGEGVIGMEGVRMLGRVGDGSCVVSRGGSHRRWLRSTRTWMIDLVILYFCS